VGESLIGRPPPTEFSFNGSLALGGQFHCMRKRTRRDRSTRQSARHGADRMSRGDGAEGLGELVGERFSFFS
jgi:hypothetical protein